MKWPWPTFTYITGTCIIAENLITGYFDHSLFNFILGIVGAIVAVVFIVAKGLRARFERAIEKNRPPTVAMVFLSVLAAFVISALLFYLCLARTHA